MYAKLFTEAAIRDLELFVLYPGDDRDRGMPG